MPTSQVHIIPKLPHGKSGYKVLDDVGISLLKHYKGPYSGVLILIRVPIYFSPSLGTVTYPSPTRLAGRNVPDFCEAAAQRLQDLWCKRYWTGFPNFRCPYNRGVRHIKVYALDPKP